MRSRLSILALFLAVTSGLSFVAPAQAQDALVRVIELSVSGYEQGLAVAVSPDGGQIAIGLSSGVALYHSQSLLQERFIETGVWSRSLAYSPDGETIAAGLFDGTARQWRVSDGSPLQIFEGHTNWVRSVAFSRDGELLITAADDDTVRVWNIDDGSLRLEIEQLDGVRVVALSPDDQTLAVGMQDASIQLLEISNGSLMDTLTGHEDWVRSLDFSPNGRKLASGAFDATARIWDVESGRLEFTLSGHQSSVLGLEFSPDGNTLATGSVDTTVKVWNVGNGSLLRTLVGHTDFVYGVAFSPDGSFLVSSAGDNTARVWDVAHPETDPAPQPSTSSDCRDCHHPRGISAPPRVIQISCEACHADGIGLNWCASFPRSANAVSEAVYVAPLDSVGVPITAADVAVVISYPTNGETVYASSYHLSPVFVRGRVFYPGAKSSVIVHLEIRLGELLIEELSTQADAGGNFTFSLAANPQGAPVVAGAKAADPDCASCHEDFKSQASLPDGKIQLVVTATLPDGQQASDNRWITVDTSGRAEVDVLVIDKKNGTAIPGLPVNAETILYEWRERYSSGVSSPNGTVSLFLEALSQSATRYEVTVPPTSLNGNLYKGVEPLFIELRPGTTDYEPVTMYVDVRRGRIAGELAGALPDDPLELWAVHLPEGMAYKTSSKNGVFLFDQIPTGEYRVFVDLEMELLRSEPVDVDLTNESEAEIRIELTDNPAGLISGRILDEAGNPLPFGWVTAGSDRNGAVDPITGSYSLSGLELERAGVIVDAPGYYSQAGAVDFSAEANEKLDFVLVRRPETTILPWGEGNVVLPAETVYEFDQGSIDLQNGWVWGENLNGSALSLHAGRMRIVVTKGSFALEISPAREGWFYLKNGEALIITEAGQEIPVRGTRMTALSEGFTPIPVPYTERVFSALNLHGTSPLQNKWEPSLEAQIRDRLAQAGVSIAQFVTFVTYMLVQIVIVAFLIGGIYSTWKYMRKPSR